MLNFKMIMSRFTKLLAQAVKSGSEIMKHFPLCMGHHRVQTYTSFITFKTYGRILNLLY